MTAVDFIFSNFDIENFIDSIISFNFIAQIFIDSHIKIAAFILNVIIINNLRIISVTVHAPITEALKKVSIYTVCCN